MRNINRLAQGVCQVWKLCIPKVWHLMCTRFDFPMLLQRGWGWDREGSVETTTLNACDFFSSSFFFKKGLSFLFSSCTFYIFNLAALWDGVQVQCQQGSKGLGGSNLVQTTTKPKLCSFPLCNLSTESLFSPTSVTLKVVCFKGGTKLMNLNLIIIITSLAINKKQIQFELWQNLQIHTLKIV